MDTRHLEVFGQGDGETRMKHVIARTLRRIADRLERDPIRSLQVNWKMGQPVHVDIELEGQKRVVGHVYPDSPYAVPAEPVLS